MNMLLMSMPDQNDIISSIHDTTQIYNSGQLSALYYKISWNVWRDDAASGVTIV